MIIRNIINYEFQLARGKVEKSNANATVEKLESDLSEMKALFNNEMSMRVSKQEQLESELKGLQHELLEKEELLRTSVSMEDMKKVQHENEKMNSIKKSLDQKINDLEESLGKAEENIKNQEEKYHKNIQVSYYS